MGMGLEAIIAEVEGKVESLTAEAEYVQEELEKARTTLEYLRMLRNPAPRATRKTAVRKSALQTQTNGEQPHAKSIPLKVEQIMQEHGGTMRPTEIAAALAQKGITTTAKKGMLPIVVSALMRREDLFERVERGVYRLKK